jgi:hypothetical protein
MRESAPTIMFCGLPVIVAALPTFEAIATASRYGTGLRRSERVTSITIGVITRHTASLTRNAEKAAAVIATVASRMKGEWACNSTHLVISRKKPDSRKCATTIIMPSKSASVSRLIAR